MSEVNKSLNLTCFLSTHYQFKISNRRCFEKLNKMENKLRVELDLDLIVIDFNSNVFVGAEIEVDCVRLRSKLIDLFKSKLVLLLVSGIERLIC